VRAQQVQVRGRAEIEKSARGDRESIVITELPFQVNKARLIEQIASSFEKYRAKRFFIVDDLFGQDRLETLRFLRLLHEYQHKVKTRFKVVVQIRLDKAQDAELLQAMRDVAGNDVCQGADTHRVIVGDAGAAPGVFGQVAEERQGGGAHGGEIRNMTGPGKLIGGSVRDGDILIETG
jgi:hypothetical protein